MLDACDRMRATLSARSVSLTARNARNLLVEKGYSGRDWPKNELYDIGTKLELTTTPDT